MKNKMKNKIYLLLFLPFTVLSQEQIKEQEELPIAGKEEVKIKLADKQVLRKGNDLYKEKKYSDAEAKYKKAIQQNQNYKSAFYNLSNSMYSQEKFKEALPGYELVAKSTDDKEFKAQSFHNMGNVLLKDKQYAKAVSAFKNSLRLNPKDDETRYNLALAQDLLEKQQNQENKDNKDDKSGENSENKDDKDDKSGENSENNDDKSGENSENLDDKSGEK